MSKELEALKKIRDKADLEFFIPLDEDFEIIETALKEKENIEKSINELFCGKNGEVITSIEIKKKLKALEIIKECFNFNGFDELIPNSKWFANEDKQKILREILNEK